MKHTMDKLEIGCRLLQAYAKTKYNVKADETQYPSRWRDRGSARGLKSVTPGKCRVMLSAMRVASIMGLDVDRLLVFQINICKTLGECEDVLMEMQDHAWDKQQVTN